ncbi:hypothetical protein VCSRO90_3857 [Vibrio cholerae]|nr:hypothetical protein VCSRO90_3857 [Vibrio cholerae]
MFKERLVKIKDVFGQDKNSLYEKVYSIYDPDGKVIYVGRADKQNVAQRIAGHISHIFATDRPSKLSKYLFENHPDYFDWELKIYETSDVSTMIGQTFSCNQCAETALYLHLKNNGNQPVCNASQPSGKCTCKRT